MLDVNSDDVSRNVFAYFPVLFCSQLILYFLWVFFQGVFERTRQASNVSRGIELVTVTQQQLNGANLFRKFCFSHWLQMTSRNTRLRCEYEWRRCVGERWVAGGGTNMQMEEVYIYIWWKKYIYGQLKYKKIGVLLI